MEIDVKIQPKGAPAVLRRVSATGPLIVGRSPDCSIPIQSDLVSRQHARITVHGDRIHVEDLSTNGTYAGELLLRRTAADVPWGTAIMLGDVRLKVLPAGAASQAFSSAGGGVGSAAGHRQKRAPLGSQRPSTPQSGGPTPLPPLAPSSPPPPGTPALAPDAVEPVPFSIIGSAMKLRPGEAPAAVRRSIHKLLLQHLNLAALDADKLDDPSMRPKVLTALRRIVDQMGDQLPEGVDRQRLVGELVDEALGLGPLERFLSDDKVSEIMVVDPDTIYIEESGKLKLSGARFTDDERVRACIERIVTPLGRRIDESSPLVDARLADGSRVNAVIPPLALKGSAITIRKFAKTPLTLQDLIGFGALSEAMGRFLTRSVIAKRNILISGGTGSGKTTLLNVLSGSIPEDERIVTIEDAAELQLVQPHVVGLETRPPNMEGKGEFTIRDLLKNAMRMRPDRVVIGECRGGEALDMLQAMNTGHDGSLTTLHSNTTGEAIARLETLVLMAGVDLPVKAIREQIANSIHVVIQQTRFSDGSRRISEIAEVVGLDHDTGTVELMPIFQFARTGTAADGKVLGEFRATGYLPTYLTEFIVKGLIKPGEAFL